ncbi:terminase small subunit [Lactiplantibacillus plantarum]|uniref:Phage terminase, small subunit n=1 Tax=Lactiplantibacillus plantarum CMPG5300 TaxID=1304889 RepID=A0AAW3FMZ8_LACPN|nr:terminase small subunit [Lactiplantibacillus plantarum]ATI71908.1 terminase small subunit [Lactiplantibacillus plantarum]KGH42503.1 Phage terminase, small subunit [Lactiplantibacillus plantarum CMPG5300]MCZ2138426.1 terminase small subunit [Lactiplantibacillus plantarum]MCZ2274906.1 terminase small subunit [Lactiplantibacillus plantarum]VTU54546.1 terminase small subunit [Lactiplantibacillus plantarum]
MKRKLTPKQQRFADEYIKSGNAADAARKAGYSKQTARTVGQQNLTKLDIKKYIDERMAEIASKRIMDATEAVELLTSIARGETKETVISSTPEGVYESQKEADLKTRISAVKEILKRYPGDDKLVKAQISKAEADVRIATAKARIVEHQADELEGAGRINPLLSALAKGAQRLVSEEEEDDANTTK